MATAPTTTKKVNYLNNRDILKEIHLSKNTYCSYADPVNDHQYDIILPTVEKINQRTIAEARRNRADRIKKETGVVATVGVSGVTLTRSSNSDTESVTVPKSQQTTIIEQQGPISIKNRVLSSGTTTITLKQ